ncbi:sensor histidine kinase [Nocardioides sp. AX2bis]|uniref:sensor histidine kinase n=1 Tax=Nocardioides sp. AX2bis TaxID=2653157 RepID=UPI0012F462B3|nr:HAMP domain-containing sensor histidine kinase [Nocardioides sp. AX2bis]VXB89692.1 putative sensor histidine kinase TcrY [Nocardioides sp. AX2bis]
MRHPRTLTARLVATVVVLTVLTTLVVGAVATLATRSYLLERLDRDVTRSLERIPGPGEVFGSPPPQGDLPQGVPLGAVTAVRTDQGEVGGGILGPDGDEELPDDALAVLTEVRPDGEARQVDLPGLGSYRAAAVSTSGGVVVSALPEESVTEVVTRLVLVQAGVGGAVALLALTAGGWLVRRQLRPLREVAGTARGVAALRLDSGDVDLGERVPAHLVDDRTEVGQVGAALDTLLDHVGAALAARQRSELQVRQFVADASHELRTPLATIAGYSELARRRPDDAVAARTALAKVEEESHRMTALVEDLLLLARLDSGRPLEQAPVDLSRLLVEAVADAQVLAPGHRWRLELPAEPLVVPGDVLRLHQVVTNLLTNARKYTPDGTEVTVVGDPAGFTVHDDGPGFDPAVAPHAFERFVRGDPARHRGTGVGPGPGGVGLGLSLVQAVVTAHGGTVALRSAPGDTTIDVRLPGAVSVPPSADPA